MTNDYTSKSYYELIFIIDDAYEAAQCMKGLDSVAECKYLDQVNDACTEMHRRNNLTIKASKKERVIPWGDSHLQDNLF